eukprot:scaffold708_cov128-Skeletonema_marinoi.AAC.2
MASRELVLRCRMRSAPHDCFFWKRKKVDDRIWPEQQKSPTSTSSNFNLLTKHSHARCSLPQKHIISTKSAARSSDIIVHRAHHHRSSFSAVELLLD